MRLVPTELTEGEQSLREQVRAFLAARLPAGSYPPGKPIAGFQSVQLHLVELAQAASSPLPPPLPRP